jgi:hypothetical protein
MNRDERMAFVKSKLRLFVPTIALQTGAIRNALNEVAGQIVDKWEQDLQPTQIFNELGHTNET